MKKIIQTLTSGSSYSRLCAYIKNIVHFIGDMVSMEDECMCCCRHRCC